MNNNGDTLEAALGNAARGWRVIPIPAGGKKPVLPAWPARATTDEKQIHCWWPSGTQHQLGLVFGRASDLIDIEGDDEAAETKLHELFDGNIPRTPTYRGKRGLHRLFRWSEDMPHAVGSDAKAVWKIGNLEFRIGGESPDGTAKGAQSLCPPSRHPSGVLYEWVISPEECEVATLPAKFIEKLKSHEERTPEPKPKINGHSPPHHDHAPLDRDKIIDRASKYVSKMPSAISGQGGQNATFHAACELFRFGLTHAEARGLFEDFNARCEPPWTEQDLERKLNEAHDAVTASGQFGCRLNNNRPSSPTRSNNHQSNAEQPEPPDDYDDEPEPSDDQDKTQLPTVTLPGGSTTITEASARFGDLLAATGRIFQRGDSVSDLAHDQDGQPILRIIKPPGFASRLESVANLIAIKKTKDGFEEVPTTCSETTARLILNASEFKKRLPPIHVLSPCPVIVERDGQLVSIVGYDRDSGVLAAGESPPDISLDDARKLLAEITADFKHTTPSDRARHLASIITPAMVLGGLLGGRAPVDLTEANESQAGKGFKNKITAAIYGMKLKTITQRKSGVGGIEESFSGALISGAAFISLDNMRGNLDMPALESFLTEDKFAARVPYSGDVEIDARRISVMFTSNKAEITIDLGNRSSITRILKQDDGFQFRQYPNGDILDHVRAHQPRYLGAVFAIIKAWHEAGKPRTTETRHDFRKWSTALDWIVQNLLACPPLMDGHRETQQRMATPALTWLRDVALAVARAGKVGQWLRTYELLDVAEAAGLELPGATETTDLEDEVTRNKVLRVIGKKLGGCFREDLVRIDDVTIQRRQSLDHEFRQRPEYQFTAVTDAATP